MAPELNPYQPPASNDVVEPSSEGEVDLASRKNRLGAALIDGFIGMAVMIPAQYAFGIYDNFPKFRQLTLLELLAWALCGFTFWLVVHGHSLTTRGQTLGKRLVGIQIVNVTDGRRASVGRIAFVRHLPTLIAGVIPVIGSFLTLADVLFIFRDDRRCIHDHIAGTRVINYRDPNSA